MEKLVDAFSEEANVDDPERIVSAGLGIALFVAGVRELKDPSIKTYPEILLGAYLIFRAVTAFCPLKEVLSKNR